VRYWELFQFAAPETVIVITALLVLAADLLALHDLPLRTRFGISAMIAGVGCAGAVAFLLVGHAQGDLMSGMFVVNPLTQLMKVGLLVLAIFTILISVDTDFTTHVGAGIARHSGDDVSRQCGRLADDFRFARNDKPHTLHPHGVQQTQRAIHGGSA
jgi:hypothetical protein